MKKLPIGIQAFSEMINGNYLYVDKTRHITELITSGKYFFLSRPRRFGKSLLVSTLKEIFSGKKALFEGLYIYDKIDWNPHPVIHLDLSLIDYSTDDELKTSLIHKLDSIRIEHQLSVDTHGFKAYFHNVIQGLYQKYGKVVVLVDEYDKPIIDFVDAREKALKNRNLLRDFYSVLKGADEYLQFVFLTGVSKFSRVSVFSGLNNLNDITLAPQYATITGYTQDELNAYFDEYLHRFSQEERLQREQLLATIKDWYNGYSWNGKDTVYNPFSILKFFSEKQFRNYWFATGTPTFLIQLIHQKKTDITSLEQKRVSELLFDSYDIDRMDVLALLFQTGYLTITEIWKEYGIEYTLNYPNREVKESFLIYILERFTVHDKSDIQVAVNQLKRDLRTGDVEGFITIIRSMLAKIPYSLHIPQEAYYHSLFYMIFALMGVELDLEILTDKGRIDGILEFDENIYLIEFKYGKAGTDMSRLTGQAIQQIREKQYEERFLNDSRKRFLLGIGFIEKEIGYQCVCS